MEVENVFTFIACSFFLIGGMLHLIRYHIGEEEYFVGITTPSAAIIIISLSILSFPQWSIVVSLFLLSILMVIDIPYPRVEGIFSIPAVILILLAITLGEKYRTIFFLLLGSIIYAIVGPFYTSYLLRRNRKSSERK